MSSKLERDIDEVLAKIERFPPRRPLASRIRRSIGNAFEGFGRALGGIRWPNISIGQVLLVGLLIVVIGYVFGDSIGGPSLVRWMIIGGILTFVIAFVLSLRRQSSSRLPEKRWRGETLDLDSGGEPWWKRWRGRR
ncbi:MAG: hypothetical protein WD379_03155 [Dehalococcoidia bacterium]